MKHKLSSSLVISFTSRHSSKGSHKRTQEALKKVVNDILMVVPSLDCPLVFKVSDVTDMKSLGVSQSFFPWEIISHFNDCFLTLV